MSGILRVRLDHVDARKGIIRLLSFKNSTMVHKTLSLEIGREVEIALPGFLFDTDDDVSALEAENQKNVDRIQELERGMEAMLVPQDEVHHAVIADLRSEIDQLRQDRQALIKLAESSSGAFKEMVNSMKVKELNQLLETASLSTEGNKNEKQERLSNHFEEIDARTKINLLSHANADLQKAYKDDVSTKNKERTQEAHRDNVEYNEAGGVKSHQQRSEEAGNREQSSDRLDETEAAEDDGSGIDKQEDNAVRTNAPHESRDDHRQQTHQSSTESAGKQHEDRRQEDAGQAEEKVAGNDEDSGSDESKGQDGSGEDQNEGEAAERQEEAASEQRKAASEQKKAAREQKKASKGGK